MPLNTIKEYLEKSGCSVEINRTTLSISYLEYSKEVKVDGEWIQEAKSFIRSNQYEFEIESRKLIGPKLLEIGVAKLNQEYFGRPDYTFNTSGSVKVTLGYCTKRFALSFLASSEYKDFLEAIVVRKLRGSRVLKFEDLLWIPVSIRYESRRKLDKTRLLQDAVPALEACLFKLAVETGECWDFRRKKNNRVYSFYEENEFKELNIPKAKYDSNLLKYFKVAISSQYPSQSFLSFYHVLEYNFLSVSDESLHGKLKAHIQSTSFSGEHEQIEKVISIVKKHSDNSDETEMLTRVMRKYVDEEDLIEFIEEFEKKTGEKVYTKNTEIFGERFHVQAKKDHAISNVAKLLKHIRNALVHSSDRYNRENCHIPLTESENIIEAYIPLVRYLAEKIIYARSS